MYWSPRPSGHLVLKVYGPRIFSFNFFGCHHFSRNGMVKFPVKQLQGFIKLTVHQDELVTCISGEEGKGGTVRI